MKGGFLKVAYDIVYVDSVELERLLFAENYYSRTLEGP